MLYLFGHFDSISITSVFLFLGFVFILLVPIVKFLVIPFLDQKLYSK